MQNYTNTLPFVILNIKLMLVIFTECEHNLLIEYDPFGNLDEKYFKRPALSLSKGLPFH